MADVAIISTGNELIHGRTKDLNSEYLSRMLFPTGFRVRLRLTVGDVVEDLIYAVSQALSRADITLITGGLGLTEDDHTLEILKRIFGFSVTVHIPGRKKMESFFKSSGKIPTEEDLKMVTVPEGADIFENESGLASGYALGVNGRLIIAMPGVPREMQHMFEHHVMPYLGNKFTVENNPFIEFRVILIGEAEADRIVKAMNVPFGDVDWGITTIPGMNTIMFTAKPGRTFPEKVIKEEMNRCFGEKLLAPGYTNLERELVHLMAAKDITLAAAESCTGGLIAKRVTDIPGSSRVFSGGIVAYSNESKCSILDVPGDVIESYGAVSEETAQAMAAGARVRFGSTLAVSVTGIAGPGGGTPEKPVGTVCFGLAAPEGVRSTSEHITGDRERIRVLSSQYALEYIRHHVKKGI